MLKSEDYLYLKRLVKADLAHMEATAPKTAQGRDIAVNFRKRVLKCLETLTK
jgi:hypothetical protein